MNNKEAIVTLQKMKSYIATQEELDHINMAIKALEERPTDEWIETKHRLNLLIGVLYSNQLISECDINYIEDSIKKLMKGSEKENE